MDGATLLYTAMLLHDRDEVDASLAQALADATCDVIECRDVDDAAVHSPELVVVDVADPAPMCAKLSVRLRGAAVVAVTDAAELAKALEAGATDCIARPVRHMELVARIHAAMRGAGERARRVKRERKLSEELRKLQHDKRTLERTSCVDSLTGVANRRHTLELLDAEWKRSLRDGTQLSLVMVDLDNFHAFNERYSHVGGDDCLRRACAAMVGCLRRPSDFLGRYGGEEFLAVLANTDAVGGKLVAERLRAAVEALAIEHAAASGGRVTISVGFATDRARAEMTATDLLAKADHALLTAKALGKNRVVGEAPPAPVRPPVSALPWQRFPVVVADPWFAARIPAFLAARRDDARALTDAHQAGSYERARTIARRMRAAAIEHGFERIQLLATLLELAARRHDAGLLDQAIGELVEYVDHVQVTYRRPLDHSA
jgi:diguanylate cyclase (GGDEF)-like protein